jgi:hypothetical protein
MKLYKNNHKLDGAFDMLNEAQNKIFKELNADEGKHDKVIDQFWKSYEDIGKQHDKLVKSSYSLAYKDLNKSFKDEISGIILNELGYKDTSQSREIVQTFMPEFFTSYKIW